APLPTFALVGGGAVGQRGADLDAVALVDQHTLVVGRALVRPTELGDPVDLGRAVVGGDVDRVGRDLGDDTRLGRGDDVAGVDGRPTLEAGPDEGGLAAGQRHGPTRHVHAHER